MHTRRGVLLFALEEEIVDSRVRDVGTDMREMKEAAGNSSTDRKGTGMGAEEDEEMAGETGHSDYKRKREKRERRKRREKREKREKRGKKERGEKRERARRGEH